ncbi:hypothetical protein DVH24_005738 [Malus domestica]|uniref:Uncharacterized protein n=1 Tax=Malus domestica TaxID=3750 RepID=A0A498IMY0_MALDO|nr:hypothetical protein DVH24_005738 [Malus domestica]
MEHVLQRGEAFKAITQPILKNAACLRGSNGTDSVEHQHKRLVSVGEGSHFSKSWLVNVKRVYMPFNLDNHSVIVEMNLIASRIIGGLLHFHFKSIELMSVDLPLNLIKLQNVSAFRLRMTVDMWLWVHNL